MPSFDIVCELDLSEVDNAVNQANRELGQRFDFKNTKSSIKREDLSLTIESTDDYKVKASYDVLQTKLAKRNVSLKSLEPQKIEPAAGGRARQKIVLKKGIETDQARELVKKIKTSSKKIQASIQGDQLRISGKKRDELQDVISLVKGLDYPLPLQFANFRD